MHTKVGSVGPAPTKTSSHDFSFSWNRVSITSGKRELTFYSTHIRFFFFPFLYNIPHKGIHNVPRILANKHKLHTIMAS